MKYLKFNDKHEAAGFAHEVALRDGVDPMKQLRPAGFGIQPDGTLEIPDEAAERLPERAKQALADLPEQAGRPERPGKPTTRGKP